MRTQLYRNLLILAWVLVLLTGLPFLGQAAPPAQGPSPAVIFERMRTQAGGELEIYWDEKTGLPRFLRGQIPTQVTVAANPEMSARTFFRSYAGLYRMQNPDTELVVTESSRDKLGMVHTRFRQEVAGIPVWGAVMVVHANPAGQITAVNGEYIPNISVDVTPDLSLAEGLIIVKHDLGDNGAEFRANRSDLMVYARHNHPPALTWKINVFSHNPLGNWVYFIDAHTGAIVHRLNQLDTVKGLETYDANYGTTLPGTLTCTNDDGTCPAGDFDEKAAHQHTSLAYDYFFTTFGRDSYNNSGAIIRSSVHYSLLYNNAFWDGTYLVYGDGDGTTYIGLARALDIVGHELTHAVTEHEAGLIYEDESGALNESYSDVFGTMVEFYGDFPNADWLGAEDVYTPGIPDDALRDLSNPSSGAAGLWNPLTPFGDGQPDHMSLYADLSLYRDNGGVHINSGIPNKAAYLIAEGGTFYGITVAGIGITDTAKIYYRTLTEYLTPTSNFMDARNASIQACMDIFGDPHANCTAVQDGFAAVGIGASSTPPAHMTYLPLVMKTSTCSPTGIYGRVTQSGAPVSGVSLLLRRCPYDDGDCSTQLTTTTGGQGCYKFTGAPSLPGSDYYYYVRYRNTSSTYNHRLWSWYGDPITSYSAETNTYGGNFDIADVVLGPPDSQSAAPLPVTFSWNIRSASELYEWELFEPGPGPAYYSLDPEYGRSSHTLTSLPAGFFPFVLYGWHALVYTADGFGVPYYFNYVKFSTSGLLSGLREREQETRAPAWQVRDLDDLEARR